MNNNEKLHRYAHLLLKTALDLQKGQDLIINSMLEAAPLVRELTAMAYQMGAKEVVINWSDSECDRARYLYQDQAALETVPEWKAEMLNSYSRKGCAYLRIAGEDPDAFAGVDASRMAAARNALSKATREAANARNTGISPWLVAAYPSEKWACKVFPELVPEEAMDRLWDAILLATRADENTPDPHAAWEEHQKNLTQHTNWLNEQQFVAMRYHNSIGTDFTVGLVKNHIWAGGGASLKNGRRYIPNMPTEEVFSMPDRGVAEGTLVASLPLNHNGTMIEGIRLKFHERKVVEYDAAAGKDALRAILDTDEGAKRLGEIALIPADSPLCRMGILFYSTLFDENASCHFALGESYAENLLNGENMTEEESLAAGANQSLTHVDFMVGTKDLSITGICADGREVPVFANGNWA